MFRSNLGEPRTLYPLLRFLYPVSCSPIPVSRLRAKGSGISGSFSFPGDVIISPGSLSRYQSLQYSDQEKEFLSSPEIDVTSTSFHFTLGGTSR